MRKSIIKVYSYLKVLEELKLKINTAQHRAILSVNKELVLLYWDIGKTILKQEENQGWGAKIIDRLSKDLEKSFPNMKGFSLRNLKYMKKFASVYPNKTIVQQLAAQIPWFHNCVLLDKVKEKKERIWYIGKTIENNWSRNVLVHQIEKNLYKRQKNTNKLTNFKNTLPAFQSDLAQQTIKDPYIFDFLNITENIKELDLQKELLNHITKFLLELGSGFAFVGSQFHLEVSNKDFYIDLLFYHLNLRCYVVVELKTGEFKPEDVGQLGFYLSAVDDQVKAKNDKPTIGIILCKSKDKVIVEYALKNMMNPVGVAEYQLYRTIPEEFRKRLPSVKKIEKELGELQV